MPARHWGHEKLASLFGQVSARVLAGSVGRCPNGCMNESTRPRVEVQQGGSARLLGDAFGSGHGLDRISTPPKLDHAVNLRDVAQAAPGILRPRVWFRSSQLVRQGSSLVEQCGQRMTALTLLCARQG